MPMALKFNPEANILLSIKQIPVSQGARQIVYDENFYGGGGGGRDCGWKRGVCSERCLKWRGGGIIKGSFQKHLKTGGG